MAVTAQTLERTTEVVYVCSPDWQHYLFTSLRSLLASGTSFSRVVIYCIGKRPRHWCFVDPRIVVEEVEPLSGSYFLINKVYMCQSRADRVIFLDADTMVLKPLDSLYRNVASDFIGRVAGQYQNENWDQEQWVQALGLVNADETPYFNSGLIIFQNGTQQRISSLWPDFTRKNLAGELMDLKSPRFAEQLSLSLAIGAARLSCHLLDKTEHAYGWRKEPYSDAVVFHTSGPFLPIATAIECELGIANLDLPAFRGRNKINSVRLHRKLRHTQARFKNFVKAWRA